MTTSLQSNTPGHATSFAPAAPDAPKSSAWLEAEREFAQRPPALPAATAAVVVVKRSRVTVPNPGPATPGPDAPASAEPQASAPRVFRLVDSRPDAQPQQPVPPPRAVRTGPMPRRRLPGADKRPGPLVRVVSAPSELRAPSAAHEAAAEAPVPGSRALAERLAEVTPILAAIQTARSFRFIDERCAPEWRRLSEAADRLMRQIGRGG